MSEPPDLLNPPMDTHSQLNQLIVNSWYESNNKEVAARTSKNHSNSSNNDIITTTTKQQQQQQQQQQSLVTVEDHQRLRRNGVKCVRCGLAIRNQENLPVHLKRHLNYKPYSCALCDSYQGYDAEEVLRHINRNHSEGDSGEGEEKVQHKPQTDLEAELSEMMTLSGYNNHHDISSSSDERDVSHPPLPSTSSPDETNPRSALRRQCSLCHNSFTNNSPISLIKHLKSHLNLPFYKCGSCDWTTGSWTALKKHAEQAHPTTAVAYLVSKQPSGETKTDLDSNKSPIRNALTRLIRLAFPAENPPRVQCALCDQMVEWTESSLTEHREEHSDYSPYQCGECSHSTHSLSQMLAHTKAVHPSLPPAIIYLPELEDELNALSIPTVATAFPLLSSDSLEAIEPEVGGGGSHDGVEGGDNLSSDHTGGDLGRDEEEDNESGISLAACHSPMALLKDGLAVTVGGNPEKNGIECRLCHARISQNVSSKIAHAKIHLGYKPLECLHCRTFKHFAMSKIQRHTTRVHPNKPVKVDYHPVPTINRQIRETRIQCFGHQQQNMDGGKTIIGHGQDGNVSGGDLKVMTASGGVGVGGVDYGVGGRQQHSSPSQSDDSGLPLSSNHYSPSLNSIASSLPITPSKFLEGLLNNQQPSSLSLIPTTATNGNGNRKSGGKGKQGNECNQNGVVGVSEGQSESYDLSGVGKRACILCNTYIANNPSSFDNHACKHLDYKPYHCGYCQYQSYIRGKVTRHIQQVHSGMEVKISNDKIAQMKMQCFPFLGQEQDLTEVGEGGDNNSGRLGRSGSKGLSPSLLAAENNNGVEDIMCMICSATVMALPSQMDEHIQSHIPEKYFHCPVCTYQTHRLIRAKQHVHSAHPNNQETRILCCPKDGLKGLNLLRIGCFGPAVWSPDVLGFSAVDDESLMPTNDLDLTDSSHMMASLVAAAAAVGNRNNNIPQQKNGERIIEPIEFGSTEETVNRNRFLSQRKNEEPSTSSAEDRPINLSINKKNHRMIDQFKQELLLNNESSQHNQESLGNKQQSKIIVGNSGEWGIGSVIAGVGGAPMIACGLCLEAVISQPKAIMAHLVTHLADYKPYECDYCKRRESTEMPLKAHSLSSHKNLPIKITFHSETEELLRIQDSCFPLLMGSYVHPQQLAITRDMKPVVDLGGLVHHQQNESLPPGEQGLGPRTTTNGDSMDVNGGNNNSCNNYGDNNKSNNNNTVLKKLICQLCHNSIADNPKSIGIHVKNHLNYKPYRCPFCKYMSCEQSKARRHVEHVHSASGDTVQTHPQENIKERITEMKFRCFPNYLNDGGNSSGLSTLNNNNGSNNRGSNNVEVTKNNDNNDNDAAMNNTIDKIMEEVATAMNNTCTSAMNDSGMTQEQQLEQHQQQLQPSSTVLPIIKCSLCQQAIYMDKIDDHVKTHLGKPIKCPGCVLRFWTVDKAKAHIDSHHPHLSASNTPIQAEYWTQEGHHMEIRERCFPELSMAMAATMNPLNMIAMSMADTSSLPYNNNNNNLPLNEVCGDQGVLMTEGNHTSRNNDGNGTSTSSKAPLLAVDGKMICQVCEQPVSCNPNSLEVHAKTHLNFKQHQCGYCNYRSCISGKVKRHLDNVHRGLEAKMSSLTNLPSGIKQIITDMRTACFPQTASSSSSSSSSNNPNSEPVTNIHNNNNNSNNNNNPNAADSPLKDFQQQQSQQPQRSRSGLGRLVETLKIRLVEDLQEMGENNGGGQQGGDGVNDGEAALAAALAVEGQQQNNAAAQLLLPFSSSTSSLSSSSMNSFFQQHHSNTMLMNNCANNNNNNNNGNSAAAAAAAFNLMPPAGPTHFGGGSSVSNSPGPSSSSASALLFNMNDYSNNSPAPHQSASISINLSSSTPLSSIFDDPTAEETMIVLDPTNSGRGGDAENASENGGVGKLQCQLCKTHVADNPSSLGLHVRNHLDYKPFSCNLCDYKSCIQAKVKRHLRNVHKCPSDDMTYSPEPDIRLKVMDMKLKCFPRIIEAAESAVNGGSQPSNYNNNNNKQNGRSISSQFLDNILSGTVENGGISTSRSLMAAINAMTNPDNVMECQDQELEPPAAKMAKEMDDNKKKKSTTTTNQNGREAAQVSCNLCSSLVVGNSEVEQKAHVESAHRSESEWFCSECGHGSYLEWRIRDHINSEHLTTTSAQPIKFDAPPFTPDVLDKLLDECFNVSATEDTNEQDPAEGSEIQSGGEDASGWKDDAAEDGDQNIIPIPVQNYNPSTLSPRHGCEVCGQRVELKWVDEHVKDHLDYKPYSCTHCSFKAAVKSKVSRHLNADHKPLPQTVDYFPSPGIDDQIVAMRKQCFPSLTTETANEQEEQEEEEEEEEENEALLSDETAAAASTKNGSLISCK